MKHKVNKEHLLKDLKQQVTGLENEWFTPEHVLRNLFCIMRGHGFFDTFESEDKKYMVYQKVKEI